MTDAEFKRLSRLAERTLKDRNQGKERGQVALGILRARDELAKGNDA